MDQLRTKIEEVRHRFNSALDDIQKLSENEVFHILWRIDRLHSTLLELSNEVERVVRENRLNR